jgi:hypothetical protein
MKASLCLLVTFLFHFTASVSVFSQELKDYYTGKDTLEINGEVYKVTVRGHFITLENINYILSYQQQRYPSGEPVLYNDRTNLINKEVIRKSRLACFSKQELLALKTEGAFISFHHAISLDGQILETQISISSSGRYIFSLPPEKIITFAETIKENAKFSVHPFVKKSGLTFVKKEMNIPFKEFFR